MALYRKPSSRSNRNSSFNSNGDTGDHYVEHHVETELLIDEIRAVKIKKFDMDGQSDTSHQTVSEKSIRRLYTQLVKLKEASVEEVYKSVYANYGAFLQTYQELSGLGEEILTMRSLLSKQAAVVQALVQDIGLEFLTNMTNKITAPDENYPVKVEDNQLVDDTFDALIAEKRIGEALETLIELERSAFEENDEGYANDDSIKHLQELISRRKVILAELLVEIIQQPSTCGNELRSAILALCRLDDAPRAHSLLLSTYSAKLTYNIQELSSSVSCFSDTYISTLSRLVFSTLSQAVKYSHLIFGNPSGFMSELILWASNEVDKFLSIIERFIKFYCSTTGALHVAAMCAWTASGYCSLLEAQGLYLRHAFAKHFRQKILNMLEDAVKHINESVTAVAALDDWIVSPPSELMDSHISGISSQIKLSSSAWKFHQLIQNHFDDMARLTDMDLETAVLNDSAYLFESYVEVLMRALPSLEEFQNVDNIRVQVAKSEKQQIGILANVFYLQEELVTRALPKLLPSNQGTARKEWRNRLQRATDRIRDHYCRNKVVELIFTEEDVSRLSAEDYILMHNYGDNLDPMPSHLFQNLFFKVRELKDISAILLEGRDRTTFGLLKKLLQAFAKHILYEQDAEGSMDKDLGGSGLQQFMLDMHFLLQMAFKGQCMTRTLQNLVAEVINNAKCMHGQDPLSLPEDDWFKATAQNCFDRLMGDILTGDT